MLDGRTSALTVDGCDFSGRIVRIYGNVTLKRSRIIGADGVDCSGPGIAIQDGAGPVVIEDVEITTSNPNAPGGAARQDRTICVFKNNAQPLTISRLWTHDTMRGLDFTTQQNITVLDSYLGPNVSPPTGQPPGSCVNSSERPHASAIRAAGSSHHIRIINSVLRIGACSWASGLIATYTEQGPSSSDAGYANHEWEIGGGMWIIEADNGGYGIAAGCDWYGPHNVPTAYQNYNFNVHGLKISTEFQTSGCPAGCAQGWNNVAGTAIWSNVTKHHPGFSDHGNPVTASTPQGGASVSCPRANQ